ncbi:hypothetical protein KCP74_22855 [Salmonella enterica subsp. enterica]|nr:hypothetical protein KCP74_22855 [Salmonella enterica subsp. enterica]
MKAVRLVVDHRADGRRCRDRSLPDEAHRNAFIDQRGVSRNFHRPSQTISRLPLPDGRHKFSPRTAFQWLPARCDTVPAPAGASHLNDWWLSSHSWFGNTATGENSAHIHRTPLFHRIRLHPAHRVEVDHFGGIFQRCDTYPSSLSA